MSEVTRILSKAKTMPSRSPAWATWVGAEPAIGAPAPVSGAGWTLPGQ
jgi:hypothetical protein